MQQAYKNKDCINHQNVPIQDNTGLSIFKRNVDI